MDVPEFVANNAAEFAASLKEWLAIPSVSADPARHGDVRRSAQWLAEHLRRTGFPVVEIWETKGLPAVYAHWPAADDKAQVLFHTLGLRACLAAHDITAPPVSISMLVEGEEESGSPHFADLLAEHVRTLNPDVIVISDTTMWAADVPSICTGMRGLAEAEITLTGPTRDLHSGSFGGGVPNPVHGMAEVLAGLHDKDGRVTMPGFYD